MYKPETLVSILRKTGLVGGMEKGEGKTKYIRSRNPPVLELLHYFVLHGFSESIARASNLDTKYVFL